MKATRLYIVNPTGASLRFQSENNFLDAGSILQYSQRLALIAVMPSSVQYWSNSDFSRHLLTSDTGVFMQVCVPDQRV
jgi:hypothetical protein